MSANTVLLLQSMLITLQMVNAGIATIPSVPTAVAVIASAVVGGFQFYVNHLGNQIVPPSPPASRP
jgi:hypothetical protein